MTPVRRVIRLANPLALIGIGLIIGLYLRQAPRSANPPSVPTRTPARVTVGYPNPASPHGRSFLSLRPVDGPLPREYRAEWALTMLFDEPDGGSSSVLFVLEDPRRSSQ